MGIACSGVVRGKDKHGGRGRVNLYACMCLEELEKHFSSFILESARKDQVASIVFFHPAFSLYHEVTFLLFD